MTLPSRTRRPESFMRGMAARDARPGESGRGRGFGGALLRFPVQGADLVAELGALADPVVDAVGVQHHALLGAGGDGVVVAQALDVAAVPRTARVGDDDVVERALLGAATGQADLDHFGCSCVAQSPGRRGKPGIVMDQAVAGEAAPGHRFTPDRRPAAKPARRPRSAPGSADGWRASPWGPAPSRPGCPPTSVA